MSRLNDLLHELRTKEPALARDLEREVDALADRRAFGLNFERHVPEAVELPGRKVRKGDKVRIVPPRGQMPKKADEKLWQVVGIERRQGTASLVAQEGDESTDAVLDDLVVVAEFRDPIYPGLVSTGKVERGGDKPFHAVINAENYHALETLLFTHRGKVDCIYTDPPYNTGAKDWKYNNDYIEGDDLYRHSKWLAFMERRLLLAKELLNPEDSVLVVTIDEKEYSRLGMLLEQVFPEARLQMITTVTNPSGSSRIDMFSRSDEYLYFVLLGKAKVIPTTDDMLNDASSSARFEVRWDSLRRRGNASRRSRIPSLFYPIYFSKDSGAFHHAGEAVPLGSSDAQQFPGLDAVLPVTADGSEMTWSLSPSGLADRLAKGYVRYYRKVTGEYVIRFIQEGTIKAINTGDVVPDGLDEYGFPKWIFVAARRMTPMTTWRRPSHSASDYGTPTLTALISSRRPFPYPKSLYAVEDAIRFFVSSKPSCLVVDFFSGSGTTAHAVLRLNKQDGGIRQSISITNNEVSAEDQVVLRRKGFRPGDATWEERGICDFISIPRIQAAITGRTPNGDAVKGVYKFTDEFPLADGFEENVEFFKLTYEAPLRVASNREFARIAPLLWMRAGSRGRRIEDIASGWDVAETYGVLADLDHTEDFLKAIAANDGAAIAYIVTDEDRLFESVTQELPDHIEPVRLYEAYLRNFEIESGRAAL